MNRIIVVFLILIFTTARSTAQMGNHNMLFVIDSLPVIYTPSPFNELWEEDIASKMVVANKDSLRIPGTLYFDSITYIFTKAYNNRADSIEKLPSLKQMNLRDSSWYFNGMPYTGAYVDYYYSGNKMAQGYLLNGKQNGEVTDFYPNGKIATITSFKNGRTYGRSLSYYRNGDIKFKGTLDEYFRGESAAYYPDGTLEYRNTAANSAGYDSMINYSSIGEIKEFLIFKAGRLIMTDTVTKRALLISDKMQKLVKAESFRSAKKMLAEITEIDPTNALAYYNYGFYLFEKNKFTEAIVAFDKAIAIEPFSIAALAYGAAARVKKYEPVRVWKKNSENGVLFLAPADTSAVPENERKKICDYLTRVDSLRSIYAFSFDFLMLDISKRYCGTDMRR